MENKNLPAEIHPLKSEETNAPGKGEANCAVKVIPLKTTGRLSRWRTAAFFVSLFLCLIAVFAFSFIVPCPVRPISQTMWNRTYDNAAAYQFLTTRDVNGDMVEDIFIALQASDDDNLTRREMNSTCADEGFTSPCAYMVTLSGAYGNTLWQMPVAQEILQMDCSLESRDYPGCLVVGTPNIITFLNLRTGKTIWKQNINFGVNATVLKPSLIVPDVNGDSISDFLIFTSTGDKIKSWFFSGKQGVLLGSQGSLNIRGWISHLMHRTEKGAYYVLFCTSATLYGYSIRELYHIAFGVPQHKDFSVVDPLWEIAIDSVSHVVSLVSTDEILYLKKMPTYLGMKILVVRSTRLELLDGKKLGSLWANNISHTLSEPAFGSYTRNTADILIESSVTPIKKKVRIVSGVSGDIEWELEIFWRDGYPQPATIGTVDHRSMFLFWGTNETNPARSQEKFLYLFHPSYSKVFLELKRVVEHIVAFKVVLFEHSRHACNLLLTGAQVGGVPGQVTIYKQKLKEDIGISRVIWIDHVAEETDDHVKEHFLRLRYSSN